LCLRDPPASDCSITWPSAVSSAISSLLFPWVPFESSVITATPAVAIAAERHASDSTAARHANRPAAEPEGEGEADEDEDAR